MHGSAAFKLKHSKVTEWASARVQADTNDESEAQRTELVNEIAKEWRCPMSTAPMKLLVCTLQAFIHSSRAGTFGVFD